MKILHITSVYPVSEGDPYGMIIANLCETIHKKNADICVLSPRSSSDEPVQNRNGILIYRFPYMPFRKLEKIPGTSGILFAVKTSFVAFVSLPFFFFFELIYGIKCIRREKITIIHSHWILPHGLIGAILSALFNIPHVSSVHGTDLSILNKSGLLKIYLKFLTMHTDMITTNSSFTMNHISNNTDCPLKIIPMGVSKEWLETEIPMHKERPYKQIIFVGRLIPLKGVHTLISAIDIINKRNYNIRLVIIGKGPELKSCILQVEKLQLSDMVIFKDFVSHDKLKKYYIESDLFVLPSQEINGQTEGLGVVLLEAMAVGIPVIGSNTGGIPDIIKDNVNGLLVKPGDPEDLAKAIINIFENETLADDFRKAGRKTIEEKFSWEIIADSFIEVYRGITR